MISNSGAVNVLRVDWLGNYVNVKTARLRRLGEGAATAGSRLSREATNFFVILRRPRGGWNRVLYDDLYATHATGEIRWGKPGFFDNASCIWWEVAPAKGAPPHYSVCVGEADHLPRVVRSREHNLNYVYTLTKWNVTAVVLPAEAKIVAN